MLQKKNEEEQAREIMIKTAKGCLDGFRSTVMERFANAKGVEGHADERGVKAVVLASGDLAEIKAFCTMMESAVSYPSLTIAVVAVAEDQQREGESPKPTTSEIPGTETVTKTP